MSLDDWAPLYRRLVKAYSKTESGEQCAAYFEALKGYPEGILEQAIARTIAEDKFWPTAADVRTRASGLLAGQTYEPSRCDVCHGDQFVAAGDQQHFNRRYTNYVRACPQCRPEARA